VEVLAELVLARGLASDRASAMRLAANSEGSLDRAAELADPDIWSFREELLLGLGAAEIEPLDIAKAVAAFIDGAGKDSAARRGRARQAAGFAALAYRHLVRRLCGMSDPADGEINRFVESARIHLHDDVEAAALAARRCLEALEHIDRNANQANWLESWLCDLAVIPMRAGGALVGGV
jgi:hypothetical protein